MSAPSTRVATPPGALRSAREAQPQLRSSSLDKTERGREGERRRGAVAEAARLSAAAKVSADCNCICIYYLQLASTTRQPGRHTDSHTSTHRDTITHTQWHTHFIETDWLQLQRIPSPASAYYLYTSARRPCPPVSPLSLCLCHCHCLPLSVRLAYVWEQSGPCLAAAPLMNFL